MCVCVCVCKNGINCLKIVDPYISMTMRTEQKKNNEQNCNVIKWNLFAKIRNCSSLMLDTISLRQFIALAVVLRVLGNTSPRIK